MPEGQAGTGADRLAGTLPCGFGLVGGVADEYGNRHVHQDVVPRCGCFRAEDERADDYPRPQADIDTSDGPVHFVVLGGDAAVVPAEDGGNRNDLDGVLHRGGRHAEDEDG